MTEYRKAAGAVEHKATKYDGFKLIKTDHPYKHQKGSGRAAAFELAKDGMLVGTWTKNCAKEGFESKFVVGSLIKLQGAKEPGWKISEKNDKGQTLDEVKKVREVDPVKLAEREARAKLTAEKKAAREAKAAEKKAAADKKKADKKVADDKKAADAKAKKPAPKK